MTKRRSWILVAAAVWTVYVWATRIWIIARLSNGTGFKVVHYVLAAISIGFAIAIGWIGVQGLRERSREVSPTDTQTSKPSSEVSPTS